MSKITTLEDQILSRLESGYIIEARGLVVHDKSSLTLDKWRQIGRDIIGSYDRCNWALGDWINLVRGEWGETYTMAMKVTGLTYDWLQQLALVAKAFSRSDRMSINLAWSYFRYSGVVGGSHHDRMNFLKLAEIEGLTIDQFREKIAALNKAKRTPEQQQVVEKRIATRKEAKAKTIRQPTVRLPKEPTVRLPKVDTKPVVKCPHCGSIFKVQGNLVK